MSTIWLRIAVRGELIVWVFGNYGYAEPCLLLVPMALLGTFGTFYLAWRSRTNRSRLQH